MSTFLKTSKTQKTLIKVLSKIKTSIIKNLDNFKKIKMRLWEKTQWSDNKYNNFFLKKVRKEKVLTEEVHRNPNLAKSI
jgi:hypothetical protein